MSATDVPLEQRELLEYFTVLTESSKHDEVKIIEFADPVARDLQEHPRRPQR